MQVLALRFDLRFPQSQSLKEKRALLRPIVTTLRQRFELSVAETDHQDTWQRCELAVAIVGAEVRVIEQVADDVERHVWRSDGVEVLRVEHFWLDTA